MKHFLLFSLLFVMSASWLHAADYNFLTFRQADGTEQSFGISGLTLTFSDGNLVVQQGGTTQTFPLSELNKMFFSESATAIAQPSSVPTAIQVFSVSGVRVGEFQSAEKMGQQLPQGVYMIKQGDKTVKVYIK